MHWRWIGVAAILALAGCSGMSVDNFAGRTPKLVVDQYFDGRTRAWGLFEDRFGRVRRQFTVDMVGQKQGDEFVLDEHFTYDDGETQSRIWRIRETGPDTYEGRAGDVVGVAIGRASGNALNWRYTLNLPIDGRTWAVDFDDWMFLQRGGVLLNRAHMSKWGIELGSVTLLFQKPQASLSQSPVADPTAAK